MTCCIPWRFERWDFCALLSTQCRAEFRDSMRPNQDQQHHNQHKHHSQVLAAEHLEASPAAHNQPELSCLFPRIGPAVNHLDKLLMMLYPLHTHNLKMLHSSYCYHWLYVGDPHSLDSDMVSATSDPLIQLLCRWSIVSGSLWSSIITGPSLNCHMHLKYHNSITNGHKLPALELDCSTGMQLLQWFCPFCQLHSQPARQHTNRNELQSSRLR